MVDNPPNQTELSKEMLQSLAAYAPDAIRAISGTQEGTARDLLASQQATAPGYAELQNQITRDYGPEASRIGNEINRSNQLAASQTEADILAGPGQDLISGAIEAQQQVDPEFYSSRASVGDAINKYLSSYSPTELTGSELEQINRGISAREGPVTPSALRTVKNAATFGNAATQRWQNFGNAVMQASSALPSLKSGMSGFEVATRRPLVSNVGENRLSSPEAISATSALNNNFGFANNALNQIGAFGLGYQQKWKDFADVNSQASKSAGEYVNAVKGIAGMMGCWVAREVFGNDNPMWLLFRAWLTEDAPIWLLRGYLKYGQRVAKWLHNHPMLKSIVRKWMTSRIEAKFH